MSERVNTEGLPPAKVLAALYNRARPLGMGFLHYTPEPMTDAQAATLLRDATYFDYVQGRVMKVDLKNASGFDPRLYDRDNGAGAAESAIAPLRSQAGAR